MMSRLTPRILLFVNGMFPLSIQMLNWFLCSLVQFSVVPGHCSTVVPLLFDHPVCTILWSRSTRTLKTTSVNIRSTT